MRRALLRLVPVAVLVASFLSVAPVAVASPAVARVDSGGEPAVTVADAREAAAETGEPQVVGSLLSETRTVEVTSTGSFVATEHLRPVRARVRGDWAPIDTSLVLRDGVYAPRASTVDVRISAGGDGPLATVSQAGRTMSFSWPGGALPAPVVAGDRAVFESVLDGVGS